MKYRREIDGLRALAVVPVILFHAGFKGFSGGYVGVDVFFVISGYLITSIILSEKEAGIFSLLSFYERRARRILPALFVVMFACLPAAWILLLPQDMKNFSESLVAVSTFASNFLFWHQSGYFDTASELKPLLHTWSLAVEEQYYVLFPILMVLTWKFGKRCIFLSLLAIANLSFGLAEWTSRTYPGFDFFMLPTRGWEILLGAFTSFYLNRKNRKVLHHSVDQLISLVGLALVIYAVYMFNDQTPFPGIYALIPTVGAAFIILYATNQTLVGRLLGSKLFVGIGLISYSAYLWHQPILAFARQRSLDQPSNQLLAGLALTTAIFSYISWRFIEKPFRNKKIISRPQIFLYGVIASLFFIAVGLVGYDSGGFPFRFDSILIDLQKANMGVYERHVKPCWSKIENSPTLESACSFGANKPPSFALLGDSHAGALLAQLDSLGSAYGVGGGKLFLSKLPTLNNRRPYKSDRWR